MLRVLVVDDEMPARQRVKDLLADCSSKMPIEIVGEASNGIDALEFIESNEVDVMLLDIRMPEMDGIELAQHLMKLPNPPAVIFTTAYHDFALEAFEVHAVDYLLKPIRLGRLFNALSRASTMRPIPLDMLKAVSSGPRTHLSIQERGKIHLVPLSDIIYMKAELKYVALNTKEKTFLLEESLSSLEEEFKEDFVRIHRNTLVAKKSIAGFEKDPSEEGGWKVVLEGRSEKLPISRRQQHIVKQYRVLQERDGR
ncbi:MAG TPA: LytTR family DNA-binding domain-containing protein [Burkholderiales bacterium]|nr:LytTR family DNA-binding domain-containing protein [Burkholderiales bacterium]